MNPTGTRMPLSTTKWAVSHGFYKRVATPAGRQHSWSPNGFQVDSWGRCRKTNPYVAGHRWHPLTIAIAEPALPRVRAAFTELHPNSRVGSAWLTMAVVPASDRRGYVAFGRYVEKPPPLPCHVCPLTELHPAIGALL